jgi:hypothetical protein
MASDNFTKLVQQWVENGDKIKALTEEKNKIGTKMMSYMQSNNIPGINISDGKIKMAERTTQVSISYKFLEETLVKFFQQHGNPNAEVFGKNIIDFVKNERKKLDKKTIALERTINKS